MRAISRTRTLSMFAAAALGLSSVLAACGSDAEAPSSTTSVDAAAPTFAGPAGPRPVATVAAEDAPAAAPAEPFVLIVLGDSLAAGAELPVDAVLSVQLARELRRQGVRAEVRDASLAGDGAADGLARFDAATPADADGVLIELGAEDLAQGAPIESVATALSVLIERAQSRGLWVGLIGLSSPAPEDADYAAAFNAIYADLARTHDVEFYPDYYAGLIDRETGEARPELFLEDGVHPTDLGVAIVADGVADWLADALPREAQREARRGG